MKGRGPLRRFEGRIARAFAMREMGLSYDAIGLRLGLSRTRAQQLVEAGRRHMRLVTGEAGQDE